MKPSTDPVRTTVNTYDDHAPTYAQLNASEEPLVPLVAAFTRLLPAGTILDVGCGHGRDLATFAARGYQTVGIDLSAGQLAIARQLAPTARLSLADMRYLPFPDQYFDGLWVCASLLHLPKAQAPAVLQACHRVLKPGGLLYVGVKPGEGERWITAPNYGGQERFFAFYQPEELAQLVSAGGFMPLEWINEQGWLNVFARRQDSPSAPAWTHPTVKLP